MRQITRDAVVAFTNDRPFRRANTEIRATAGGTQMLLHKHVIASRIAGSYNVRFTLAGYGTQVTRDRVNGLLRHLGHITRVYQYKGDQYIYHDYKEYPIDADDLWYIDDSNQLVIL